MRDRPRHRELLRRLGGGRPARRPPRRRRSSRRRTPCTGRTAASCRSWRRGTTCATCSPSSTRRSRAPACGSTTSTASPSRAARVWSARCSSGCRSPRGSPAARAPARRRAPSRRPSAGGQPRSRPPDDPVPFPFLGLIVSGGHSGLYLARGAGRLRLPRPDARRRGRRGVRQGREDARPRLSRAARRSSAWRASGDPRAVRFPRARLKRGRFDLSFSGFKTAVWQYVRDHPPRARRRCPTSPRASRRRWSTCWSTPRPRRSTRPGVERLVVSGGVSANRRLRERMADAGRGARRRGDHPAARALHRQRRDDRARGVAAPRARRGRRSRASRPTPRCRSAWPWARLMGVRREARDALAAAGLRPQKRWGQHFLCDPARRATASSTRPAVGRTRPCSRSAPGSARSPTSSRRAPGGSI